MQQNRAQEIGKRVPQEWQNLAKMASPPASPLFSPERRENGLSVKCNKARQSSSNGQARTFLLNGLFTHPMIIMMYTILGMLITLTLASANSPIGVITKITQVAV